jgi:hypothetical protein
MFTTACPACGDSFLLPDQSLGSQVVCRCGVEFAAQPAPVPVPAQPAAPTGGPPPRTAAPLQAPPDLAPAPTADTGSAAATTAMVLGFCTLVPYLGAVCGVMAVVTGLLALRRGTPRRGFAVTGMICGVALLALQGLLIYGTYQRVVGIRGQTGQMMGTINLETIDEAIQVYRSTNGIRPPSLEALVSGDFLEPAALVNTLASGHPPPKLRDGRLVGDVDFVYVSGLSTSDGGDLILCYEALSDYGGKGTCVLQNDGRVLWLDTDDFHQRLERTQKAVAANPPAPVRGWEPPPLPSPRRP